MEEILKLNIGCGRDKKNKFPAPWINTDIDGDCADIICDVKKLPNDWSGRFDEVRASHILEHFFLDEFDSILSEWIRVLKTGGILRIIVPDLDLISEALISGVDSKKRQSISINETTPILAQIYGIGYETRSTSTEWRHRFLFNKKLISELIGRQPDISKIGFYDKNDDPAKFFDIKDDSQNSFSLCVYAIKK